MNQANITKIYARNDSRIQLKVIPGHLSLTLLITLISQL